ncbi:MAG: C25 family cysteine peptidase, partial [Candidatus Poribacteria bacterium]
MSILKSSILLAILTPIFLLITTICYAENVRIIEESKSALVLQFNLPELKFESKSVGGKSTTAVSFDGSSWTYDYGKPQVPVYTAIIGIPVSSDPSISVTDSVTNLLSGYKLPIVNDVNPESETKSFINQNNGFYPNDLVKIVPIGYLRSQRIARLTINPVQYNALNNQLRIYKSLIISISFGNFANPKIAILVPPSNGRTENTESVYEDIYKFLLNYEQAKAWRIAKGLLVADYEDQDAKLAPSVNYMSPSTQGLSYKVVVNKNGIYKLDYYYLSKAGIDPSTIDPRKIELRTGGKQIPIYVEGYIDGKFDMGDYIEFYGMKNNSIYTDDNVYWLSWATKENPNIKSWIMIVKDGKPQLATAPAPVAFKTTTRFEENKDYDPLKNVTSETADHFFWRPFRGQDPKYNKTAPVEIALPLRAPNLYSNFLTLRICFQGVTFAKGASKHIVNVKLNDSLMDVAVWEGPNEYISESTIRQGDVHRSNWLVLESEDNNDTRDDTDPKWDLFLNWIEVEYWHEFVPEDDKLEFSTETVPAVTKNALFSISKVTKPNVEVFQIDKLGAVAKIINSDVKQDGATYTVSFEDNVTQPTKYYVTTVSAILQPKSITIDEPSTLHNPANHIDYIMITHKDFLKSTQRLADFRRKQGLEVLVVDVEDIYDEFSYGIFDPRAIKRFLRYAYFNWEIMPTYVLLMGDAHWDYKYVYDVYYKKYPIYPRIYVPTYHAPSMPYGETAMDHRFVTVSGDDIIPDMIIGRIPVDTPEEADTVVNKTIEYETQTNFGPWQSKIMLIADDEKSKSGDEVFEDSRRDLAENYVPVGYETLPVYLRVIKEPYLARREIFRYMDEGVVMMEFAGHGGSYFWTHEDIFDGDDVQKLKNSFYPFVVTTTCENGYFDNPLGGNKTLVDLFLIQPKAGAVACFSATRLTYGQGNAIFDKA